MKPKTLLFAAALLLPATVFAHEAKGPNGGRIADAGVYHVELVVKNTTLDLHITDAADKLVPAAGFKATAVLIAGGKSHRIALEPAEATRLSGTAPVPFPKDPKGAVQLTAPDGSTTTANFK